MKNDNAKYFNGIDGLRFIAALLVILCHLELLLSSVEKFSSHVFLRLDFGGVGVNFFFVLSGFLITYLLLKEKNTSNTISLKIFYTKRVLRIWPLYYFVLCLGFFILPHIHAIDLPYFQKYFVINYTPNLFLYLLLLPQVAFAIFPAVPHIGQSWSIGVEEMFYLIWPIIVKKTNNLPRFIIAFIAIYIIIKAVLFYYLMLNPNNQFAIHVKNFFVMSRFENMCIGASGAYLYFFNKTKILKYVYNPILFYASITLPFILNWILFDTILQNGLYLITSFFYAIIILNVATNHAFSWLNNRLFNYLGKISYGLYMYHLMIIPMVAFFSIKYFGDGKISFLFIYIVSVLTTILVASISYSILEKPFLVLKSKLEK
ncbi:MAG: acyltransferase [Bacteroidia bacterium]